MPVDRPRLHCHSAFKHYQMYHRNCGGSDYGNSVFNYTYNINGGNICGGGFWGGLFGGIGMGIGNMLGGLLGGFGMGGLFGGFGMGGFGMGGFSPFGNGFGFGMGGFSPFGNWGLGGSNGTDETGRVGNGKSTKKSSGKDKCEDKDQNTIQGFQDRRNELLKTKDKDKALVLYNEIVDKIKEPEDESHKDSNIGIYKRILDSLKTAYDFTLENEKEPDGKAKSAEVKGAANNGNGNAVEQPGAGNGNGDAVEQPGAGNGNGRVDNNPDADHNADEGIQTLIETAKTKEYHSLDKDIKVNLPKDYSWVNGQDITEKSIYAHDESKNTSDVVPFNNNYHYSNEKFKGSDGKNTNYPRYIMITTKQGNTYCYKCQKADDKTAYYTTPKEDRNNNVYCLTIKDGKVVLLQTKGLIGMGDPDTQCD